MLVLFCIPIERNKHLWWRISQKRGDETQWYKGLMGNDKEERIRCGRRWKGEVNKVRWGRITNTEELLKKPQEGRQLYEFKAKLVYMVSSRATGATERSPVSKTNK